MLVVAIKTGEWFKIGEKIEVRVLKQRGHQIIIGIEAPAELEVYSDKLRARKAKKETAPCALSDA